MGIYFNQTEVNIRHNVKGFARFAIGWRVSPRPRATLGRASELLRAGASLSQRLFNLAAEIVIQANVRLLD